MNKQTLDQLYPSIVMAHTAVMRSFKNSTFFLTDARELQQLQNVVYNTVCYPTECSGCVCLDLGYSPWLMLTVGVARSI